MTRKEIEQQIITSIEGKLGQTVPILEKAFIRVLAVSLSGVLILVYTYIDWIKKQIFPQTADSEALDYLANWYGITRDAETTAILLITPNGTDGTEILAGTLWSQGNQVFTQTNNITLPGQVQIQALVAGVKGNLTTGSTVDLPTPIIGVTDGTVNSIALQGKDKGDLEIYRQKIIDRMRAQPQGGAVGDYIRWAKEVPLISKAFAKRIDTYVIVYPLVEGENRIPAAAKITEVQNYLQSSRRRPLCATVYAQAATERTASVTIAGLSPASFEIKNSIETALRNYFYNAYPATYSDEIDATNIISVASIWSIIVNAGGIATGVTLDISGIGAGVNNYTLPIGEIIKLGAVTWSV